MGKNVSKSNSVKLPDIATLRLAAELAQLQEQLIIAKKNCDSWGFFEDSLAMDAIKKDIEKVENKLRVISKKSEH